MNARIEILLEDETQLTYPCAISPAQAAALEGRSGHSRTETEIDIFKRTVDARGIERRKVSAFGVSLDASSLNLNIVVAPGRFGGGKKPVKNVSRCRSLLDLAKVVLPPSARDDAIDEWTDEIECAAATGRPVLRRTVSILVRSLPRLAVRSRLPKRVRERGR